MAKTTTEIVEDLTAYLMETYLIKDKWGDYTSNDTLERTIKDYLLNNQIGMIDHKG